MGVVYGAQTLHWEYPHKNFNKILQSTFQVDAWILANGNPGEDRDPMKPEPNWQLDNLPYRLTLISRNP